MATDPRETRVQALARKQHVLDRERKREYEAELASYGVDREWRIDSFTGGIKVKVLG